MRGKRLFDRTKPCGEVGQKDATPTGDHRWRSGLFFLLPKGFFGYPVFLTHSHVVFSRFCDPRLFGSPELAAFVEGR